MINFVLLSCSLCIALSRVHSLEVDREYLIGNHGSLFDIKYLYPDSQKNCTAIDVKKNIQKNGTLSFKQNNNTGIIIKRRRKLLRNSTDDKIMYEVPILDTDKSKNVSIFSINDVFRSGRKLVTDIVNNLKSSIVKNDTKSDTEGRFLNIFEIVNFNHVDCISSTGIRGICLHTFECASAGGKDMETCADGYGVCCKFQYSCAEQTSANCSTFTNPGFPKPDQDRLSCTLTVQKAFPDVKQLRLSFVQMELQPPTNGTCVDDQFVITGQNINNVIPILCGINNGQHLYVEVGEATGPFYISILSATDANRVFQIEICQLFADSDEAAPSGCLQYHTGSSGELETFNYQLQATTSTYRAPSYFNNLNYAICIQRASGSCSVTYGTSSDSTWDYEFQILNYDSDGIPLIPPDQAGAEIFNCPDDFIIVNGIRLCGERLNDASVTEDFTINAPVTELNSGPIALIFRTNGNVTGRGFHLFYKQNPCAAPINL